MLELLLAANGATVSTRGAPPSRLGRVHRLLQRRRQGHDQPPAPQARRPARDRDPPPRRLPDLTLAAPRPARRLAAPLACRGGACGCASRLSTERSFSPPEPRCSRSPTSSCGTATRAASSSRARPRAARRRASPSRVSARAPALTPPVGGFVTKQDLAAQAAHQSTAALHQLLLDSGIALAIMTVVSIWLGWLVAGRALRPLADDHQRRARHLGEQSPRAARARRARRRAHPARGHLRRPARPARGGVRRAATVRRQRVARAAHPADARAGTRRGRARRPERDRRDACAGPASASSRPASSKRG